MNVTGTAKQAAYRAAVAAAPQMPGERVWAYCKRIAAASGVSVSYVHQQVQFEKCTRIGEALRAKEAAEAATRCQVMPAGLDIGPVANFRGWPDTFYRFKLLAEAYLNVATQRGDIFAASFLREIRDMADKGQHRAASR